MATADRDPASLSLLEPACARRAHLLVPAAERLIQSARHDRDLLEIEPAIRPYDVERDHVDRARLRSPAPSRGLGLPHGRRDAPLGGLDRPRRFPPHQPGTPVRRGGRQPALCQDRTALARAPGGVSTPSSSRSTTAPISTWRSSSAASSSSRPAGSFFICADRWTLNGTARRSAGCCRRGSGCGATSTCGAPLPSSPGRRLPVDIRRVASAKRGASLSRRCAPPRRRSARPPPPRFNARRGAARRRGGARPRRRRVGVRFLVRGRRPVGARLARAPRGPARARGEAVPPIEEVGGTRVGIGVATGSDRIHRRRRAWIIERDRLVPLVMRDDIEDGRIRDARRFFFFRHQSFRSDGKGSRSRGVPEGAPGTAVHEPRSGGATSPGGAALAGSAPSIAPISGLATAPKLLVLDIAGSNEVVYDEGRFYPHHNLYFITSEGWDMEPSAGCSASRVTLFFVWSYGWSRRGGYLRFQAQYLADPPAAAGERRGGADAAISAAPSRRARFRAGSTSSRCAPTASVRAPRVRLPRHARG